MDGLRSSDHELILRCLIDDVVWHIHGHRFAFNDLFTFRGDRIERVDSYVAPLA